jgi:L-lysine 6-oxidase
MEKRYQILPKIGVARVGNSPTEFYLGPEEIGGLPTECDQGGNPVLKNGQRQQVSRFKDAAGAIKRQAAHFRVYRYDEAGTSQEVVLGNGKIEAIT